MKKFLQLLKNEDSLEKILGGIFGVITIIAILFEMSFGNFEKGAVVGGIKDIASTLITVVMLIVAINALRPKKEGNFSFENEFKKQLDLFVKENIRMLKVKDVTDGNKNYYELYMQSDFNAFFGDKTTLSPGWFMRMPPINAETYAREDLKITFHLNKGTFFRHDKIENETEAYADIAERIKTIIIRETNESTLICQYNRSNKEIEIVFKKPLTTKEDIDTIMKLIKMIYNSYLVLGDAGVKS